jgi:hypothetical protein
MVDSKNVMISAIGATSIFTILTIGMFSKNLSVKDTTIATMTVAINSAIGMFYVSK